MTNSKGLPIVRNTVHSPAYESGRVLKSSAGRLFLLRGYNAKGSGSHFIQIHDSSTVPDDGAVPELVFTSAAKDNFFIELPVDGMDFANGIYACASSTGPTKTLIGTDDIFFTAITS